MTGRRDDALRAVSEAIEIRRELADRDPTSYGGDRELSLKLPDHLASPSDSS